MVCKRTWNILESKPDGRRICKFVLREVKVKMLVIVESEIEYDNNVSHGF